LALGFRECKCGGGVGPGRRVLRCGAVAEMHDATEEYLETILEIEEEGVTPIRARLVERLGLSAAAVSEQGNRLVDQGYAELLDDRTLALTSRGRDLATSIVRRHRLAERLLVDVIGLEWEKVHREADRWEHAISAEVEAKLVELLGDPATCPHGNPIPGSAHREDPGATVPLAQARPGPVRVARISEKIELDDRALSLLAAAQLIPGSEASVLGSGPDGTTVRSGAGDRTVPTDVARLTFVVPLS
jgi:DtxR family transcriptional regulator, Mn-dependent transcriptional regulator